MAYYLRVTITIGNTYGVRWCTSGTVRDTLTLHWKYHLKRSIGNGGSFGKQETSI